MSNYRKAKSFVKYYGSEHHFYNYRCTIYGNYDDIINKYIKTVLKRDLFITQLKRKICIICIIDKIS